jgi:hypothetical protein
MRLVLALMMILVTVTIAEGSGEPLKIVPASEVLHSISLGNPLAYDNCIITGDLNLSKLEFKEDIHLIDTVNFIII